MGQRRNASSTSGSRVFAEGQRRFPLRTGAWAAAMDDVEQELDDWHLIQGDTSCILPSVLAQPVAPTGWGASLMQRAKARLYLSLSRSPKEMPLSSLGPAPLWLMGAPCDVADFQARCAELLWFSYRQGFAPIEPTALTSDVGWGCVLRAGQMLLANALMRHLVRGGRSAGDAERVVLPWFADTPGSAHPYSVHNMAQIGTLFGIKIGEWFQPSIIAKTLKLLVRKYSPFGLTCYYAHDRVLYRHNIELLCTQTELHTVHSPRSSTCAAAPDPDGPAVTGLTVWRPLLLMAAVRLGVGDSLSPLYMPAVVELFRLPQCVGIIGGKPNASLYMVGSQGDCVFYLDPHYVQTATDGEHHAAVLSMPLLHMDPCFVVGFLCSTRDEFEELYLMLAEQEARDPTACVLGTGDRDPQYGRPPSMEPVDPLAHLVFRKRTSRE